MACACKNKIKKVERLIPENKPNKPLSKLTIVLFGLIGRIITACLVILALPIVMIFIIFRIIFFPDKEMIINVDKFIKKWKNLTE